MRISEIRELIEYACDEMSYPELSKRIYIEFSNRLTRTLGTATYWKNKDLGRVKLSRKLWPTMSREKQEDTVLHEVAHIICNKFYPEDRLYDRSGHGPYWKKICRKIGCKPERFASENAADFKAHARRVTRYKVSCGCPNGIVITKTRHTKMLKGQKYRCRKCATIIGTKILETV